MQRRRFLWLVTAAPFGLAMARWLHAEEPPADEAALAEIQNGWKELLAAGAEVATTTEPLKKSDDEWKQILTREQYRVLRKEDTEPPGSSPLNDEKRPGIYVCAGCALPLFSSRMKFDSGTGWPSFYTHIPGCFGTRTDFKLILPRTEYHCIRCGGHHGHVFHDGPAPTGERWCNNGVALRFIPLQAEG